MDVNASARRARQPAAACWYRGERHEDAADPRARVRRRRHRPGRRAARAVLPAPDVQQPGPVLAVRAAALPLGDHVDLQGQPAAHAQRLDDVGLLRRGFRVAAAARPERDDARRGGKRVQPVHVPHQGAQPAASNALQHGLPGHHGAGRRGGVPPARRHRRAGLDRDAAQAARRRGHDLLRRQHAGHRYGDRAVDQPGRSSRSGTRTSSGARRATSSAPAPSAVATWMVTGWSAHWITPLAVAPLYLTYRTYKVYLGRIEDEQRHVREMADLHLATIEALALAIDAKDQTSQSHIRRVQLYAASVARALGMSDNDVQGVKTAALLHDIGKLAVPEHILSKPGPLTPEEFQKIRAHPKVGADIVSSVPFPYPVAPLILSHHERWDGKGYPTGLKGEEIPLGARILSVVDYFDALMAERPYHKAMSFDAAVGLLRQESGKGLDPAVVAKFIELLPSLQEEATRLETGDAESRRAEVSEQAIGRPATGLSPETTKKNVFEDIALAHREIYALYEIAQAMGTSLGVSDTMALIAAKLSNLVPFSCAALFLFDEDSESLRCRFASGIDAEVIQQIAVSNGEGLTGWVARNRRPLVNARPSADLEAAGLDRDDDAAVGAGLPAALQRSVHRHAVGLPHRTGLLPRRSPPPPRPRLGAGRRRHQELDALRADAVRLADRSADRPAEHALPVHAADARARPCRAAAVGDLADGHGPRQLQGDQRQPRPPRRRPRALRDRPRAAHDHPPVRHLRALRRRRVHRRDVGVRRGGGRAETRRAAARRSTRCSSRRVRASGCASASASAPRSSRTMAIHTKCCSRPPTAGCTRTRRIASAAREKTTRAGRRSAPRRPPTVIQRSASRNPLTTNAG